MAWSGRRAVCLQTQGQEVGFGSKTPNQALAAQFWVVVIPHYMDLDGGGGVDTVERLLLLI